jgi:L-fuculose-phosphate aldolase
MRTPNEMAALHRRFQIVGAALMRANLNNTHSGNMSCRDPQDATRFWITASGAACGALSPADLVAVRYDDLHHEGRARPSSETNTHRRVLQLPGANACIHCHAIASTLLGFETPQKPILLLGPETEESDPKQSLFQPLDVWGAGLIGAVTVGAYQDTVGSSEMERRIPVGLRQAPVTIVKGHGPFARGQSIEQCLHYLSVLENSAVVAAALRRRGIETLALQRAVHSAGAPSVFAWAPRALDAWDQPSQPADAPEDRCEFSAWLSYNFDRGLGAFGTGSISCKLSADEMIFCPMSSAPLEIAVPVQRVALRPDASGDGEVRLHRRIYRSTPFTACMLAASPLATAEAMAALAAAEGMDALIGKHAPPARTASAMTILAPIDAEAAHYNVRLPVTSLPALAADAPEGLLSRLLQAGDGCCLIAGAGVIAASAHGLAQAAYRVSLAERVARFRLEVDLNHRLLGAPPVTAFE